MSPAPRLTLDPRACDRCGRCLAVCERNAIRVGRTFIAIDWTRCDACGACAKACAPGAIVARGAAPKPRPATKKPSGASAGRGSRPAGAGATPRARSAAATPRARSAAAPKTGPRGGFQWSLLEAAAMLSVTFSAFVVKEALAVSSAIASLPGQLAILAQVGVLALYCALQVAVLVWLVRRRDGDPASALGLRPAGAPIASTLTSAGLVLAGLVGTRLIASAYVWLTREAGLMPEASVSLPGLFGSDAVGLLLAIVMVVVVGPLVEEAVFRGALLEGLAARFGVWPAIFVQAALFAAFHRSLWLLFPTFVLGVALGWLAHERESLWPPIAMHALYNAITVAAAFLVA